jgi:hypothetical protein
MTLNAQLEAPQPVPAERVGPALQHDGSRLEALHDLGDDWAEDRVVSGVVHAVVQRHVDRVALALLVATVLHIARAREVLAELVKGAGHHAAGGVEGLLDAVAVVDVDVDVQHALMFLQQLQDAQHAVVDIAEAAGLALLGVVQAASPVYHGVGHAFVESNRTACIYVKDGLVV